MRSWAEQAGRPVGSLVPLPVAWDLAVAWYRDRLAPDWRRRAPAETQALFGELGLTGPFWQLVP